MELLSEAVEYSRNGVKVVLEYTGEGLHGKYDEMDKYDRPLMSMCVLKCLDRDIEFTEVNDSAYCTIIPANVSAYGIEIYAKIARRIWEEVHAPVLRGESIDRLCLTLSHNHPMWLASRKQELMDETRSSLASKCMAYHNALKKIVCKNSFKNEVCDWCCRKNGHDPDCPWIMVQQGD